LSQENSARSLIERAANHDRLLVVAALAIAAAIGLWATLKSGGVLMSPASPSPDSFAYVALLFVMWWAMMLAMMLPSAAPAILGFAAIGRKIPGKRNAALLVFAAGYATIWTGFSIAAVTMQILTSDAVLLTGMMAVMNAGIGGALLMAAGVYQLTPLKNACLRNCQPPFMYLARHWRKGAAGAFRMGLSHGIYCLGCCWVLMTLLFYGGVMELSWIVGLAVYVAAEKLIPARYSVSRLAGIALISWGAVVLYRAIS
jgi:predicted metal-binding membrane protein